MKTQTTIEQKFAGWNLAFNSMSNKQSHEAKILSGLMDGLRTKMIGVV